MVASLNETPPSLLPAFSPPEPEALPNGSLPPSPELPRPPPLTSRPPPLPPPQLDGHPSAASVARPNAKCRFDIPCPLYLARTLALQLRTVRPIRSRWHARGLSVPACKKPACEAYAARGPIHSTT